MLTPHPKPYDALTSPPCFLACCGKVFVLSARSLYTQVACRWYSSQVHHTMHLTAFSGLVLY